MTRLFAWALLAAVFPAAGATSFRDDRVSLAGAWKFQLRRDNQLTGSGPVAFGPVSASSQAMMLEPWQGQTSEGRWRTGVPWPVSSTLLGSEAAGIAPSQLWKPHPQQQGPTWWTADLGSAQAVASVRVHWVKPGRVEMLAEVSADGKEWTRWVTAAAGPNEQETWVKGEAAKARFLRLTFTPSQFDGTRAIDVFLVGRDGRPGMWQPRIQKVWYEELRKFAPDGFHEPGFNDSSWADIRVPGYWETQKFSPPTWWQPDETVGYYRRTFSVPEAWRGKQVRLRFEGVNNSAQVWVNGREVGFHESGFTMFEYDVTRHLKFGAGNLIAVRVAKWTLTHDYDTDDVWFLGGLFRDTFLYALPSQRIDDFTLRTELDSQYRDAVLRAKVTLRTGEPDRVFASRLEGELLDQDRKTAPMDGFQASGFLTGGDALALDVAGRVKSPRKWTAETPYLYTLVLRLKSDGQLVHEVKHSVGFRQVEVKGDSLLLNGVPLKLRGVVTTRANPNDAGEDWKTIFAREIKILKESNINAIRSHTTPLEEEFLDLCDKHGIYILPDVPYVWVNEWDFRYLTDGAVLRAREIYEQHKNRPSVIVWHIGNENDLSSGYRGMGQAAAWLERNDPTRPVTICRNRADMKEFATAINDLHYYPMREPQFQKPTEAPLIFGEFHALPEEIERLKDRGFVETWGRSLKLEWAEFEKRRWLAGGLICCWDDGSVNGDIGPRQWGVVDSKRQAKDVWYHIRKVFAPVALKLEPARLEQGMLRATLRVENKYNFTDLSSHTFQWELRGGGKKMAEGRESYKVAPGSQSEFPFEAKAPAGSEVLRLTVRDEEGYSIQNEEFVLSESAGAAVAADVLKRAGVQAAPGKPRDYGAAWTPGVGLEVRTPKGEPLLTVAGFVLQKAKSRKENTALGRVEFGPPQPGAGGLVVPFVVEEDGKAAEGQLRIEYGPHWIRAVYELQPARELVIREIGLRVQLVERWRALAWDRASLWSSGPEDWADGPRARVPIEALRESGSRRNVYWAGLEAEGSGLLIAPLATTTNLRAGDSPRELVLSEFLDSGDFLGKFDRETTEKKLPAGEKQTGGFTIHLVKAAEWAKLVR